MLDLGHFRNLLVAKRLELLQALQDRDEIKIEGRAADALDEALASSARTIAVERMNRDMKILRLVEIALAKLNELHETFGECVECEASIPEARLLAVPWAERCVDCQQEHDEQNKQAETPQYVRRFR